MKKCLLAVLSILLVASLCSYGGESCDNKKQPCDPCKDPNCEVGGNPFSPFSGNVIRRIPDLKLAAQVGEIPMEFRRVMTSRPEWVNRPHDDFPFGQPGNWRHSFLWTILDDGETEQGEQKIQIIDPESTVYFFHKKDANDMFMTHLPNFSLRMEDAGTNYYLYTIDGTRHHITEQTGSVYNVYRMEGIWDPFSNYYEFVYDTNDLIQEVRGPNTNHFFTFQYSEVTNSVDPGIIRFSYTNAAATNVLLAGSFNGWQGSENPMVLSNGEWIADVNLSNGSYDYKFYVYEDGSTNGIWVTDPDNELYGGADNNSVIVVDPFRTISRVDASDGRYVTYQYDWVYNTSTVENYALDVLLTSATYGDGTSSAYTYYPATYDQERKTLPKTADDPMLSGRGRAVMYTYRTNTPYSGKVSEEFSLTTTQLLGRLYNDQTFSNLHVFVDAGGNTNYFGYHEYTANLLTWTNAVGDVYRREYFDGWYPYDDDDQQGQLWKEVDPLGRTTVYERTVHFGAVLSISNANGTCGCGADVVNEYTNTNYPFYLSATTDKGGRTTEYTRDVNNRPTRIDYPDSTYETFTYNSCGQVVTNRQRDGAVWSYEFDAEGRKTREVDPLGHSTWFTYDSHDNLASLSNALGYVTTYTYNWRGLVTNIVFPDGSEEVKWYDQYGSITQRQDRAGGITTLSYDELGFMVESTDPVGATTHYLHDNLGNLASKTTPIGLTVSNIYDAIGRKIQEVYSSDNTSRYWYYNPDGVISQANRLGYLTEFSYSDEGLLQEIIDPLGRKTSYAYDNVGNRTHVTNDLDDVTIYIYDDADRVVAIETCSGTISNVYDGMGRLVQRVDENGIQDGFTYDQSGRRTSTARGGFLIGSNAYDALGRIVRQIDANGLITSNTYNQVGQVLRSYMPDGTYWENAYSNTYLYRRTDRAGRKTTYVRDVAGQVLQLLDNATNSVLYAYDLNGALTNLTDQAGNDTAFSYDGEGRLTTKTYDDGSTLTYAYDAEGRLLSKTNAADVATHYRYDSIGNLTNIDYATDIDVFFEYDALNRMTKMSDAIGQTDYSYAESCSKVATVDGPFTGDTISYSYDAGKRLTNIVMGAYEVSYVLDGLDRIASVTGTEGTHSYTYFGNGRLIDELTLANGTKNDYTYDSLNRLSKIEHRTSASAVFGSYTYAYDDADQRTKMTRDDGRYADYNYDPVGQLLGAAGSSSWPGYSFNYQYDKAGNPVHQDRNGFVLSNSFNNLNQNTTSLWSGTVAVLGSANISNGTVTVNGVDAAEFADGTFAATNVSISTGSNKLSAVITDPFGRKNTNSVSVYAENGGYWYDGNGNLTNDGQMVYTYDDADRLIEVRDSDTGDLLMQSKYDGLGRRRERVLYSDGVGTTNRYVYDNWLVIAVLDHTDGVTETYTHGPDLSGTLGGAGGIGGILSVTEHPTLDTYTYHFDALGNVTSVTDTNETEVATYTYSPFGQVLTKTGDFQSRYTFSTKEWDSTVELNYYGYRYYSPQLGRWMNRDLIGFGGGANFYAYVNNHVGQKVDDLGLSASNYQGIGPEHFQGPDSTDGKAWLSVGISGEPGSPECQLLLGSCWTCQCTLPDATVDPVIDPGGSSWPEGMDKLSPDAGILLNHEQGHFNIAMISANAATAAARELKAANTVEGVSIPPPDICEPAEKAVTEAFDEILKAAKGSLHAEQIRYDTETDNSWDRDAQARWNEYFKSQMK
ncbi:MAG: hypothetical protein KJ626_02205 [Verrucomicrobia bacterium]|nr:hypothetical protein [Verrucomicrobiota bacterium]